MHETTNDISTALSRAAIDVQDLSTLPYLFEVLAKKSEEVARNQEEFARNQEAAEARLEARERAMMATMDSLDARVEKSLDNANNRIQGLGGSRDSLGVGMMLMSLPLWLGRDSWRGAFAAVVFTGKFLL
jgi:hypothetical protein